MANFDKRRSSGLRDPMEEFGIEPGAGRQFDGRPRRGLGREI